MYPLNLGFKVKRINYYHETYLDIWARLYLAHISAFPHNFELKLFLAIACAILPKIYLNWIWMYHIRCQMRLQTSNLQKNRYCHCTQHLAASNLLTLLHWDRDIFSAGKFLFCKFLLRLIQTLCDEVIKLLIMHQCTLYIEWETAKEFIDK